MKSTPLRAGSRPALVTFSQLMTGRRPADTPRNLLMNFLRDSKRCQMARKRELKLLPDGPGRSPRLRWGENGARILILRYSTTITPPKKAMQPRGRGPPLRWVPRPAADCQAV